VHTPVVRVLFVCLGNICRSPTAEGVFAAHVAAAGLSAQLRWDSAGLVDHHAGELADPRTRAEAERRGVVLTHRSRPIVPDDFRSFDYVLGMDGANMVRLRRMAADTGFTGTLARLRDFDPASPPGSDVPDPYYGGAEGFVEVFDLCDAAAAGLLAHLMETRGLSRSS
jgi:protein-tyrosine phosphatase